MISFVFELARLVASRESCIKVGHGQIVSVVTVS